MSPTLSSPFFFLRLPARLNGRQMLRWTPPEPDTVMDLPWLVPMHHAANLWSLTPEQAQLLIWRGVRLFEVILINGEPMVTRASLLTGLSRYG